jgi:hypothetical protein
MIEFCIKHDDPNVISSIHDVCRFIWKVKKIGIEG